MACQVRQLSALKLPKGSMNANELAELKARMLREDPDYRAKVHAAEAARRQRTQALRIAEQPIVSDLRGVGCDVDSMWDLVNTSTPYHDALPVLLAHLERGGYPDRVMESLGRALAVEPAVTWWDQLKTHYLRAKNPGEQEGLALALTAAATEAQLEDLIEFVRDESCGPSRIHFVRALLRVGGARGQSTVERLRNHPTVGKEARALLRGRRDK
jgi:ribosomal protein S21